MGRRCAATIENALTGSIPPALWRLTSLSRLHLGSNALTGPIPAGLGSLTSLYWLSLGDNALTGPAPAWLGNLSGLRGLHLSVNELSGPVPAELGNLANLQWLSLGWNELTGSIPAGLGDLANLGVAVPLCERVDGPDTGVAGRLDRPPLPGHRIERPVRPGPRGAGDLANLELLYLSYNPLTGSLPHNLTGLSQLTSLNIRNTGACVPADAAFQAWLPTIDFLGDTCNRAPEPAGAVPPQALVASGPAIGVSMGAHFSDPADDPLTHATTSSHAATVTALVSGDTVRLAPGSAGAATVTVTASDPTA